jgi:UDP-glucose 4-epimerase
LEKILANLEGKRVLVTGGAGFIGSHLVDLLAHTGSNVTVFDDFSTGSRGNIADAVSQRRVRVVTGSILDPHAVAEAMEGCDLVYHLAVQCVRRSLRDPRQSHDVNATGTLTVLEAARKLGIERFVYCSSSEVYGNASDGLLSEDATLCRPVTVYGAAKLAGELYTDAYRQTYGLPTVIVRPFNAYGPRAHHQGDLAEVVPRFVIRALNGRPPTIFGDGSNGRDFTYVTEVARGLALAGASDRAVGSKINIAYGRIVTVREVAEVVLAACGRNDMTVAYHGARPGDVHWLHADNRRAAEMLGYRAQIPFEDGTRRYLEWFRSHHPDPSSLLEEQVNNWDMPDMDRQPRTIGCQEVSR